MKKKAFTLAEVLITLSILGAVAAIMIPSTVKNVKNRLAITQLKRTYSIVNNALNQMFIMEGYPETWNDIPNQFFGTIYKPDLDKMRLTVSERSIQMSYFLNVPDDPSLAFAKIETVDYCCPENVMFIDPSAGKGDYTAVSIGGIFMRTNKFVTCGFMFNEAWFDIMDILPELLQRFNVRKLFVEQNGVGAGMPDMLRKNGINCVAVTTTQNKHQKIISVADQVPYMALTQLKSSDGFGGRLLEANQLFIENVKEYTYDAKHDDGIDSMVSLIKEGFGIRTNNRREQ